MKQRSYLSLPLLVLLVLAGLTARQAWSAPPSRPAQAGYDLSWWTMDGGGAIPGPGSGYSLGGTVGQPDAGLLQNGGYTLAGGFWCGGALVTEYNVYLPLVLRGY